MFNKVLIANRGEIALRILRACKELGIQTVAVHSTADSNAMHVRLADESVCIGPPPAKDSYLNIPSIMAACEITGADAVHPLRLPLRERPLRPYPRRAQDHLHRPVLAPYRDHGRQDHRQEDRRRARHPGRPRLGRRGRDRGGRQTDRGGHRLSGAHQGDGGRRRTRHEGRPFRGGPAALVVHGALGGQGRVRQRVRLHGEVSRQAAAYRGAGDGRRAGQCRPSRHPRLRAAAPPSEGLGGGRRPDRAARQQMEIGEICAAAMRKLSTPAPAPSSSSTRTASSTSSR